MCLMYWLVLNFVRSSEEKGGPLLVKSHLGGLYCEMSCCSSSYIESAVLDEALNTDWSLPKVLHMKRYSLPWYMKNLAVSYWHGLLGTSRGSIGYTIWVVLLRAYSAPLNIVSIYSRPIDSCLGDELQFLVPWCLSWRSARVLSYSSGGMHILLPLMSRHSSMDTSSLVPKNCWAICGNWWMYLSHPCKVLW